MKRQVQAAVDAGIPSWCLILLWTATHSSFVATDNKQGGVIGGKELVRLVGDKKGAKVMCMRFVQGTGSTEARSQRFH